MKRPIKKIVLDASAVLSFIIFDEKIPPIVKEVFDLYSHGECQFVAPDLLKLEVSNALRSAVKSKRLSKDIALSILKEFLNLEILYKKVEEISVLEMAINQEISVYDATYLWLSKKHQIDLVTLDKNLKLLT